MAFTGIQLSNFFEQKMKNIHWALNSLKNADAYESMSLVITGSDNGPCIPESLPK